MTKVAVPFRFKSENANNTGPAVLEVGGQDISRLTRSVLIEASVGEVSTVNVQMYAKDGLDVTLPAAVTVVMQPLSEGIMDVTTLNDDTVRYRFVRKSDADD